MTTTKTPAVYVGTYHKYNSGSIYGEWIPITNPDEFWAACKELHKDEQDPEFMFQDYEGFPRRLYDESRISDELFEFAEKWESLTESEQVAFVEYINMGLPICDFEEAYCGWWESEKDFAENLVQDIYSLDDLGPLAYYIDYDRYARDLFIDDYWYSDGFVFRNI